MRSIFDWFGYPLPLAERFTMIKAAGFGATALWGGEAHDESFGRGRWLSNGAYPKLARQAGLSVEFVHGEFDEINRIWEDGPAGDGELGKHLLCLERCAAAEIPVYVMHADRGTNPPPVSERGLARFAALLERAGRLGVCVAVENLRNVQQIERAALLLETFDCPALGYCFDAGHFHARLGPCDWLTRWPGRLQALHLHDNHGPVTGGLADDEHLLPFDGTADWPARMREIAATGYAGPTTLEVEGKGGRYNSTLPPEEFLARAYQCAARLEEMRG